MAVTLTVNGSSFSYPSSETDTFWGAAATGWAQAVTNGMLQKAGGSFTLTANVDFGASFGLKSAFFGSRTANPSSAGLLRLANIDTFGFRNAANSGDLLFSINPANDHLLFDGVDLSASSSSGNVVGPGSSTDNALARYNGITGQLLRNSNAILNDAGDLDLAGDLDIGGDIVMNGELSGVTDITASGDLAFGSIGATPANLVKNAITEAPTAFTPTPFTTGGGTAPTYATNSSKYFQIGKMVFVNIQLSNSSGGTAGAGAFQLKLTLPVAPAYSYNIGPVGQATNSATFLALTATISSTTNSINLGHIASLTSNVQFLASQQDNGSRTIFLNFFYEAA